jgi:GTP-binding protein
MVLIMDARHPLTPLDRQMLDWFTPTGKPVHILLSKADKLSNSEKALTLRKVKQDLASLDSVTVQLFSSLSRLGADEAAGVIEGWLQQADDAGEGVAQFPEGAENPESAVSAEVGNHLD